MHRKQGAGGSSFLTLLLLFLILSGIGPKQAKAQWYLNENLVFAFGIYTGLDFRTGAPVPIATGAAGHPSSLRPPQGFTTGLANASVCDTNGNLLFYTNGSHVWDSTHVPMSNGNPLHNRPVNTIGLTQACPQGALIVPFIGDPYRYYVFSHISPANSGELFYSVVDMRLNNGRGDVVPGQKWIRLGREMAGSLIAIPGNQCNVWVVAHARDTNQFYVFEITGAGLNTTPMIQTVGNYAVTPPHYPGGPTPSYWRESFMDPSQDGKHFVLSATNGRIVEMYDFDGFNGIISNPVIVDSGFKVRCAMFSPDDSKIYTVSERNDGQNYWGIYQFEVNHASSAAMRASKVEVSNCLIPETHLKLAPDGKMYFLNSRNAMGFPNYSGRDIGVIHAPNERGVLCQFDSLALTLPDPTTTAIYGFAHYVVRENRYFRQRVDTLICGPFQPTPLHAPPGYSSYEWDDGTTSAVRTITDRGRYWVKSINNCIERTDTFVVRGANVDFDLGPDIVVCENPQPVTLLIPLPDADIIWSDGSAAREQIISSSGTYWATASSEGCTVSDTIHIQLTHIPQDLGNDTLICTDSEINPPFTISARLPSGAASVRWSTGGSDPSITVRETGMYWAEVSEGACMDRDSIYIEFANLTQFIGNDTVICHDEPINLELNANVPPDAEAIWSTGSTMQYIMATEPGEYSVIVSYGHCSGWDDIRIEQEMCRCSVFIPDAFTPNGDGRNDVFRPSTEHNCPVRGYTLQVFNRWGELVYTGIHGNDLSRGWDGTHHGAPAAPGVYMYQLSLEVGLEGERVISRGDVMLVR